MFADTSGRALVVDIDPQRTAEEIITASDVVAFDFAAEDDPRVLEQLRTVREYDAIIVDCPGNLEDTETLAGVLASASYAVIPMIPERAAVQPTLRTARLCADHKVRSPGRDQHGRPAAGERARSSRPGGCSTTWRSRGWSRSSAATWRTARPSSTAG